MSLSSHIVELKRKHLSLSELVEKEEHNPLPDPLRIQSLKKQKLRIKEEISRMEPLANA